MAHHVLHPDELEWIERSPDGDGPPRYVARLSEAAGFAHSRGNMWRFPAGARGRRHRDLSQEETFVVLAGTLSMYVGDPPERIDVPTGGLIHVDAGTVIQSVNHGEDELRMYVYGAPPDEGADVLPDAV